VVGGGDDGGRVEGFVEEVGEGFADVADVRGFLAVFGAAEVGGCAVRLLGLAVGDGGGCSRVAVCRGLGIFAEEGRDGRGWSEDEVHVIVAAMILDGLEEGLVARVLSDFADALIGKESLLHLCELASLQAAPGLSSVVIVGEIIPVTAALAAKCACCDVMEQLLDLFLVRGALAVPIMVVSFCSVGI
jgi:hypothetical protein